MSVFLTIIEILDSDGFDETIITLTFFSAKVVKIFAALPGAANNIPPLRSIRPIFRIAATHFTVFLVFADGEAVTSVPLLLFLKLLRIRIGIFLANNGSKVLGWICLAPNCAISIASVYETSFKSFEFFTSFGSAVIKPSTSLINQTSSALIEDAIIVAV